MSDSKDILNSEEVEFLLEASAGPAGQETPSAGGAQQVATMRGDLEQMNLADIFQTIGLAKMEGVLKVCNPVEQRLVYFRDGAVRILVPPRAAMRRLGQRLVQAGVLDPEQLRLALLEQRKEHRPLGELLVDGGYVTEEQIDDILTLQITEELFGLFTWAHGGFEFYKGKPDDAQLQERIESATEFEVNSLLLEVARRSDEWEGILASLQNLDEIPVASGDGADQHDLDEQHRSVLVAVDGRHTYRELADIAVMSVFDCARTARALMERGLILRATDEHTLEVAKSHLEQGSGKMALLLVQALCDRTSSRSVGLVREMAGIMRQANEAARACALLLEAAQLQSDATLSMELAREALAMNPRDLGAQSFLRTTMMAHLPIDAPEIEGVTLALLDGLLADNDVERVFAIVDETKQLQVCTPEVMVREARALAKRRDREAAIDVLLAAAAIHEAAGEKTRQIQLLEMACRFDRERKDLHKQLRALRSTPQTRALKWGVVATIALVLMSVGAIWFMTKVREQRVAAAADEISTLLKADDRKGAATALARWRELLGEGAEVEDMAAQIRFADATETQRLHKEAMKRASDRLQAAGDLALRGELTEAFRIYAEMAATPELQKDVDDAAQARLEALLRDLVEAGKHLPGLLPEPPNELMERQQIEEVLTTLRRQAPTGLRDAARALLRQRDEGGLPIAIPADKRQELIAAAERAAELLDRGAELIRAYEAAAARNEEQRRLDPLFKSALDAERRLDFANALVAYRQLAAADAGSTSVRTHFAQKVQQLEGIVAACTAIAKATAAGDYAAANRLYQALALSQPQIPFHQVVRLPVTLRSSMPGARVRWNGVDAGRTPQLASYAPGTQNLLELALDRFEPVKVPLPPDHHGTVEVVLTLLPNRTLELPAAVDQPIGVGEGGRVFAVDRAGSVLAFDLGAGKVAWRLATGDTAGYLSPPIVYRDLLLVGSLDGPLRAIQQADGRVAWHRDDLATEFAPALLDGRLALATRKEIVLLDPKGGEILGHVALPAEPRHDLIGDQRTLVAALGNGTLLAVDVKDLQTAWSCQPGDLGQNLAVTDRGLVALRDDGHIAFVDLANGEKRWERQLPGTPTGRPAVQDGRVLLTFDDRLLLLSLADGRDLWQAPRTENGWHGSARLLGSAIAAPTRAGSVLVYTAKSDRPVYRLRGDRDLAICGNGTDFMIVTAGRQLALYRNLP